MTLDQLARIVYEEGEDWAVRSRHHIAVPWENATKDRKSYSRKMARYLLDRIPELLEVQT